MRHRMMALPEMRAVAIAAEQAPWWWPWVTAALAGVGGACWLVVKWAMAQYEDVRKSGMAQLAEQRAQFVAYLEGDAHRREQAIEVQTRVLLSLEQVHAGLGQLHAQERDEEATLERIHRAVVR